MSHDPRILDALRAAESIAVLSGAGVSAESGIPTFRDALNGLWSKFDPEDLATAQAFARDPELVSRWYDERRCNIAHCRPNPGHAALARLQKVAAKGGKTFTLITQNVDRLHQAAGSTDVLELHGTLWIWRCVECSQETACRSVRRLIRNFSPALIEACPCSNRPIENHFVRR